MSVRSALTGNAGESVRLALLYEVTGAGGDAFTNADAFRYLYQQISGNCTIIARVDSLQDIATAWGEAGVMMRESITDAGAVKAYIGVSMSMARSTPTAPVMGRRIHTII